MKTILFKLVGLYLNCISYISRSHATQRALKLFTQPRSGKINEQQSDFLGTAFREELNYDGYEIMTYRWLGNKKTILLAHGWESNSARWQSLIYQLCKKQYNVIAIDAPAHGRSSGNEFTGILYSEFINVAVKRFKPEIIIGHSVGGMASVFFQYKYQIDTIEKMILLGTPSEFTGVLKHYTDMLGYNQRITEGNNSTIIERFGKHPQEFSTAKYSQQINAKGLIIHDETDDVIPYNDALLIKDNFKNSKLITTDGLGHSLDHDNVRAYIQDFIEA